MMVELLDIIVVSAVSLVMGAITSMSGLNPGRFTAVAYVEHSVPIAVGTTIGITAMVSVTSAIYYIKSGLVHRKVFFTIATTGTAGCIIASFFTFLLPSLLVLVMIAASVAWSLYRVLSSRNPKAYDSAPESMDRGQHVKQYAAGLLAGSLSGLLGIIFTNIALGTMVHVLKGDPKMLIGTTLALSMVLAVCGVLAHLAHGNMNFILLGIMGSTGMIGGVVGSRFSTSMTPRKLRNILISIQIGGLMYLTFIIIDAILRPAVIHCTSCF